MPEVKLGDYKGLEYNLDEVAVSDEEVEAELNRMREQYAEVQTKDGAAAEGDTVNIDYSSSTILSLNFCILFTHTV